MTGFGADVVGVVVLAVVLVVAVVAGDGAVIVVDVLDADVLDEVTGGAVVEFWAGCPAGFWVADGVLAQPANAKPTRATEITRLFINVRYDTDWSAGWQKIQNCYCCPGEHPKTDTDGVGLWPRHSGGRHGVARAGK